MDKIDGECNQQSFEKRVSVDWKVPGGAPSNRENREVFKKKKTNFYQALNISFQLGRASSDHCLIAKSCPTFCDPVDCSPPGSSVHGISQARVLEWGAISLSRESSQPRDRTHISCISRWIPLPLSHLGSTFWSQCSFLKILSISYFIKFQQVQTVNISGNIELLFKNYLFAFSFKPTCNYQVTRNQTFHDLTMDTRAVPKKGAKGATLLRPRNTKITER